MSRIFICVWCGLVLSFYGLAQTLPEAANPTPLQTTFCDLIQNPAKYDGQWITVHDRIALSFENFSLADPGCPSNNLAGVWLTFGGDQDEIATYCCSNTSRKQGKDLQVNGHKIPLVRDDSLHELLRVLQTQRLRRPDGHLCEAEECFFYRPIEATITGMFFAGQAGSMPGYGHLGCCHLLIIRQVSGVFAERTPVPAGGEFICRKEDWEPSNAENTTLSALLSCAITSEKACEHDQKKAFALIAQYWTNNIDVPRGRSHWIGDSNKNSVYHWNSPDLLTSYNVTIRSTLPPSVSATRESCVPASAAFAPRPPSDRMSCFDRSKSWHSDASVAERVDELVNNNEFDAADAQIAVASKVILAYGDQSWRLTDPKSAASSALNAQMQEWAVAPRSLQFDRCDDVALSDQKSRIVSCGWYSSDGMQTWSVALRKYPKATAADPKGVRIPWVVSDIGATICQFEP